LHEQDVTDDRIGDDGSVESEPLVWRRHHAAHQGQGRCCCRVLSLNNSVKKRERQRHQSENEAKVEKTYNNFSIFGNFVKLGIHHHYGNDPAVHLTVVNIIVML
jgi:hypothetical protein